MFGESIAQQFAIQFRRLYLETISSGDIDAKTAWRLANYVNFALWTSREAVTTSIMVLGVFFVAMPLGSEVLPLATRLMYFAFTAVTMFAGLFVVLIPLHFLRIKKLISSKVSLGLAALFGVLFSSACFVFWRDLLNLNLGFTFTEIALRISPLILVTFGVGFAISPYTSNRLMRRHNLTSLTSLINEKKRGQLISISAQDHYVAITTSTGTDLTRMTLAAAIALVEPGIGLQIHRSHWIAISAIKTVNEQNRTVELINGEILPISAQHLPNLTLEISRKDSYSQQELLFARDIAEVDILTKMLKSNQDARADLDKMFLEVFQGKPLNEMQRLRQAFQIYRVSMTAPVFILMQLALFCGLAFMGTYGLYDLAWYQPPIFWTLGYLLCWIVTIPTHVLVWYTDLKYGSNGWLGIFLHTVTEGTLASAVLYGLAYVLFGPVMVPYLVFLLSTYVLHTFHAPVLHICVREHQSFSSWKKALNIPPILLHMPYETRGEIVSVSAESRAVSVKTTSGKSIVKKKFADAITLLGERQGIQTHRSHWVATDFIKARRVDGTSNYVELTTGELVPLAAANIAKVDALLRSAA
ncbi:LytTR family DNA-binding domain-containing protein [Amylibacter sp. IMCC11727]|uniref:LytTR family DNA-binding domain-containing protein n=1 Tax=Amylibacter sp. IMCC11727 TaxID=3039851 RepID=UPI00244DDEFD|nr:LytTR family DNA-binding domain-containing protein [Amylibacter sp. IMCC11727]WGI23173.1 LytTR family DNA-binding domain-containing protein [Amylibacter sp. IMCC11727]